MFDKLDGMVKDLKEHDSMLFQPNGLTLKQGEEFARDFNVEQIQSIEGKLLKVKQEVETLEENKTSFHTIYKGINKDHISKRRRKKENRRKSNERKKKRYENNVQRVYGVCVKNPLGNDLAECLQYPPSLAIPEECINAEDVAELLMRRDAPDIAEMMQSNHLSNAAGSRLITNLKREVRDDVYCILYPENESSTSKDMKAQMTRKTLKTISRNNECFNSNFISSRYFTSAMRIGKTIRRSRYNSYLHCGYK